MACNYVSCSLGSIYSEDDVTYAQRVIANQPFVHPRMLGWAYKPEMAVCSRDRNGREGGMVGAAPTGGTTYTSEGGEAMSEPRYFNYWRFVFDPFELESIDDLIETLENFADAILELRKWQKLGVQLDPDQAHENLEDGYLAFFTTDEQTAQKLGFDREEEGPG